jgi:hypothetical protein
MMDGTRFDHMTRLIAQSRRSLVGGALAVAAGLLAMPGVDARKKRKHKGRKQKAAAPNSFGCIDVGDLCQTAAQCCSGICAGKRGKKTCRAHDVGGCQGNALSEGCGDHDVACTTSDGKPGLCATTTGNAGYCATGGDCYACATDLDCQRAAGGNLGATAACIQCTYCEVTGGTACAWIENLGPAIQGEAT